MNENNQTPSQENEPNSEVNSNTLNNNTEYTPFSGSRIDLSLINQKVSEARKEMANYLIGQHEMVDLLLIGLFSGGHILLEGVPGIAKTLTAKVLARMLSVDFSRIQFTPDMMPSDIIGTSVFNMKTSEFSYKKGPIFTNIVLIDEINRAPAKTQAALFEVMEERQITYDSITHKLAFPFLVIATQNPIEQEGTYRLPEAQLDRFLFKINLDYPTLDEEQNILKRFRSGKNIDFDKVSAIFSKHDLLEIGSSIADVRIDNSILKYIAEITHNTRNHGKLYLGASPRASLSMLKTAKTIAAIRGRDFVIPEDVQFVAFHILNHRIILSPEAEMEGLNEKLMIEEIIKSVEVPR